MSAVVETENLSKCYRLGVFNRQAFFRDVAGILTGKGRSTQDVEELWALRDVNMSIRHGDIVGIIGRNGSGKSTLLKILSRITAPTQGRARTLGRVASLLEVGTGFHPELTGRENIYLNGAILGMKRNEIEGKLDEIIDFAGVESYLDTPVKRYSSGMRVRLAFAVAAHLEPDIMIIDEVLAVGDVGFQQKCLGRINDVAREGRTVLFVSHHAAAVENLCTRGIVLQKGQVVFDGNQTEALDFYSQSLGVGSKSLDDRTDRTGSGTVRIKSIEFVREDGTPARTFSSGRPVEMRFHFSDPGTRSLRNLSVEVFLKTHFDAPVFTHSNRLTGAVFPDLPQKGYFSLRIDRLPLPPGSYRLSYHVRSGVAADFLDGLQDATELHVEGGDFFGTGQLPLINKGVCLVDGSWALNAV